MDNNIHCFGIKVIQGLKNGFLGGPKSTKFNIYIDSKKFVVDINQLGKRETQIMSCSDVPSRELWYIFNTLDMLIMLMEGKFIPIENVFILNSDSSTIESADISALIGHRLNLFDSADFALGNHSSFIDIFSVISDNLYTRWIVLMKELDILHPMVLYCMANTGLPVDCKCANLIESFEALEELINMCDATYTIPKVKKCESKLGKYLEHIIIIYGKSIFSEELVTNQAQFIKILVDSRNRIAHIKSRQGKAYLNGEESILYAIKLSYLYRSVLLKLLGIDSGLYEDKIKASVQNLNEWDNILKTFLLRLN